MYAHIHPTSTTNSRAYRFLVFRSPFKEHHFSVVDAFEETASKINRDANAMSTSPLHDNTSVCSAVVVPHDSFDCFHHLSVLLFEAGRDSGRSAKKHARQQ